MKKVFSLFFTCFMLLGVFGINAAFADYNITPKAPNVSPSLRPIIVKYKNGNYLGAMLDLEELVKKEKNNTYAKYYLALCYTRLGYQEEAKILYTEVAAKNDNMALTYYSKKALTCLDDPEGAICKVTQAAPKKPEELDDMTKFIRSGKQIHPSAMDQIQRERAERKMQQDLYLQQKQLEESEGANTEIAPQQEEQVEETPEQRKARLRKERIEKAKQKAQDSGESTSMLPTNEEIAAALDILSKAGMNPFEQNQNQLLFSLANNNQMMQYGALNNNNMLNPAMMSANSDIAKMYLYNQITQQNNMLNYGL